MSSLFEINSQIAELIERMIDEETGEINEDALEQLEQLQLDQDEKLEAYGMVILNLKAEAEALTEQGNRFKKRAEVKMNRMNRMMELVSRTLKGEAKEYTNVSFGFRKSNSVNVVNEELVPDELCSFKTKRVPSKTEIGKLLKAGKEVPGCILEEKQNLQVI